MPSPARPAALRRNRAAVARTPVASGARRRAGGVPSRCRRRSWRRPSHLLQVHEERLELWGARVGVADEWRQSVRQPVTAVARVAVGGKADIAPVDGNPDLVHLLPRDRHRPETLGHEREHLDLAALGRHANLVAALDPLLVGELLRYLDKWLGLQLDEVWDVL